MTSPFQTQTTQPSIASVASTTTVPEFRMNAKGFFLTFPQCGTRTKEEAAQALKDLLGEGNILWAIIALEHHQVSDI